MGRFQLESIYLYFPPSSQLLTKEERQKLKTLQNVKRKLKNNNIIHVKADKGNGLVLINKNEYINKTLEFIKENNFTEIKKKPHQ